MIDEAKCTKNNSVCSPVAGAPLPTFLSYEYDLSPRGDNTGVLKFSSNSSMRNYLTLYNLTLNFTDISKFSGLSNSMTKPKTGFGFNIPLGDQIKMAKIDDMLFFRDAEYNRRNDSRVNLNLIR